MRRGDRGTFVSCLLSADLFVSQLIHTENNVWVGRRGKECYEWEGRKAETVVEEVNWEMRTKKGE